ncbi:hypothetical protein PAEPH01_2863, partial [Pancytospora epiphaga]
IIIHGKTRVERNKLLCEVLQQLKVHRMRANPKKLQLCKDSAVVLGMTVNGEIQTANKIKRNETLEHAIPKMVLELRRFWGGQVGLDSLLKII